jgi:glycosyltransferase involved in cell wall biosynthesis
MAAGRPILYIGPKGSTPHRIIETFKCGWQINCGDADSLVQLLHRLNRNRDLVQTAGRAARRAFADHYDLPLGTGNIAELIGAGAGRRATERARSAA